MKIFLSEEGKIPVSEGLHGLTFEDVNYALDGGIFAEMLENRNFEAKKVTEEGEGYVVVDDGAYAWDVYPKGAKVALKIKTDRPLYAENPHYLRLTTATGGTGVKNKAYEGVYLKKGMKYFISFWLRSYEYKGKAKVGVYANGKPLLERDIKIKSDGKWREYSFKLKSKHDYEQADFLFLLGGVGTVHLDWFSMMPENAIKGVFRRDLVEMLKELKPSFLRFPGGRIVLGNTLENRYCWKDTLGATEKRKHNWNCWAVPKTGDKSERFSHYGQTYGVGFYEYFQLCEYLGAKPFPVLSVGIACQRTSEEFVRYGEPELEVYLQEALDLIEFANGGVETEWGRVRAELGHPAPFNMEYLGIGHEQWEDEKTGNAFHQRFEWFERRIHEVYPKLKLVGSTGESVTLPAHDMEWEWVRKRLAENSDFVYATSEHIHATPEWLIAHSNMYDGYPRFGGKVYVGEYEAHLENKRHFNSLLDNVWETALAEAVFMMGMERNADVVAMASYAPLFGRIDYAQYSPNLIWFDGKRGYATVNYYVQKLFSLYSGNFSVKTSVEGSDKVYASATEREGLTYLKLVNIGDEAQEIEIDGDYDFGAMTYIRGMEGALKDYNGITRPNKVIPRDVAPTSARTVELPPRSIYVVMFHK